MEKPRLKKPVPKTLPNELHISVLIVVTTAVSAAMATLYSTKTPEISVSKVFKQSL